MDTTHYNTHLYWTDFTNWLSNVMDFTHQGFLQINAVLGLLIAVVAAFMLGRYRVQTVIVTTLGATVAFILAQMLIPVLDHNAPFRLPDVMVQPFWREFGLLAAGLFIAISFFYVIKRTLVRSGGH